jgi:UDP-2,4-diacetamido-2,4,6-trideoxy-beta-L-altropyranose hydrolase
MSEGQPRRPNILFRADGGAAIGSGHLRRCLSVAERLRDRGHRCLFICRASDRSFNGLVSDAGFDLIELPAADAMSQEHDAEQTLAAVGGALFDVAIVDHYGLDHIWEKAVRCVAGRLAVIDDLADRRHDCDLLIDVAPGHPARYDSLVPAGCHQLLGPNYAMLRPEFARLRQARAERSGAADRILISFGGVDPDNLTGTAIAAIRAGLPKVAIDAVLTGLSPHRQALEDHAAHDPHLSLHVDAANMAELMQAADLAIGAGGSTSWERACMGIPSIVAVIAENQRTTADALERLGCAVAVAAGPNFAAELGRLVQFLSASPALLRLMATAARATVDGRGVDRVASAICPPSIALRPATEQDARQVWEWRNAPEIRATAIDTAEIPWESHSAWFARRIADPNSVMLVAEEGAAGVGVGVVRFDLDGDAAAVSIFLAPGHAGRGMGRAILQAGERRVQTLHPEIRRFLADVRPENGASIALFRGADYRPILSCFERTVND